MTWTRGHARVDVRGNPVSCAAALATIDVIAEEHLMENADKVGTVFLEGLRDIQTRHDSDPRGPRARADDRHQFADHDAAAAVEQRRRPTRAC